MGKEVQAYLSWAISMLQAKKGDVAWEENRPNKKQRNIADLLLWLESDEFSFKNLSKSKRANFCKVLSEKLAEKKKAPSLLHDVLSHLEQHIETGNIIPEKTILWDDVTLPMEEDGESPSGKETLEEDGESLSRKETLMSPFKEGKSPTKKVIEAATQAGKYVEDSKSGVRSDHYDKIDLIYLALLVKYHAQFGGSDALPTSYQAGDSSNFQPSLRSKVEESYDKMQKAYGEPLVKVRVQFQENTVIQFPENIQCNIGKMIKGIRASCILPVKGEKDTSNSAKIAMVFPTVISSKGKQDIGISMVVPVNVNTEKAGKKSAPVVKQNICPDDKKFNQFLAELEEYHQNILEASLSSGKETKDVREVCLQKVQEAFNFSLQNQVLTEAQRKLLKEFLPEYEKITKEAPILDTQKRTAQWEAMESGTKAQKVHHTEIFMSYALLNIPDVRERLVSTYKDKISDFAQLKGYQNYQAKSVGMGFFVVVSEKTMCKNYCATALAMIAKVQKDLTPLMQQKKLLPDDMSMSLLPTVFLGQTPCQSDSIARALRSNEKGDKPVLEFAGQKIMAVDLARSSASVVFEGLLDSSVSKKRRGEESPSPLFTVMSSSECTLFKSSDKTARNNSKQPVVIQPVKVKEEQQQGFY